MKLKIKDLDYMKKLGQQSRTTSTHSPVRSKKLGQWQLRMSTTAQASSDTMEGKKIELVMSRQATAGAHQSKHAVQKVLMHVVTDIRPQHDSDTNCFNVFRSRRLVARNTMTTAEQALAAAQQCSKSSAVRDDETMEQEGPES